MHSILKISKYILVPVLSEWLRVEDFVNLDSSLCNKVARAVFLGDLEAFSKLFQNFMLNDVLTFPLSISLLVWITRRGLNMNGMTTLAINNQSLSEFSAAFGQPSLLSYVFPWRRSGVHKLKSQQDNTQMIVSVFLEKIQCLKLRLISLGNKQALGRLLQQCTNLHELHIYNPHVTVMDCVELYCHNLQICNFSGCSLLEESSLVTICRNCPLITDLHLFECRSVASLVLHCLIVHCGNLQTLDLRGCNMISKLSILQFSFHVRRPLLHFRYVNYTGLSLRTFMHYRGARLQGIEFSQQYISFLSLIDLPQLCPHLTHLNLHNNVYVTDEGIEHLTSSLPLLQRVSLHKLDAITQQSLTSIVNHCHHLTELILNYSHQLCNLNRLSLHAEQFSTLHRLSLRGLALTDFVLTGILTRCSSSLTDLDISHNIEVSDETLTVCAPFLHKLQRLIMIRLDRITHQTLYAIAFNCCGLEDLSVENCRHVTDMALLPVLKECKRLTRLDVSQCEAVTSETLSAISVNCRKLSHLILREYSWEAASLNKLLLVLDQCKKLTHFEAHHASFPRLLKKYPDIEYHYHASSF